MRALSLTLDGQPVDLPANTKGLVRLTQARNALASLDARQNEHSWPITLPKTRRNDKFFGPYRLHPQGLDKFRQTDFAYDLRCAGEVFTGTFRLQSLKGGYTGPLFGAGFSWAAELGERKLTELQFAPVVYDGSQLESILAKDRTQTDIQFPLVAYGNFYSPPVQQTQPDGSQQEVAAPAGAVLDYPLAVDDYLPSVYLVNILKRIFADIGWSLTGRVLDEPHWQQTVLLPTGADTDAAWPWGALLPAAAVGTAPSTQNSDYNNNGSYANTAVGFDELRDIFFLPVPVPVVGSAPTRALNPFRTEYTAPRAGVYAFTWAAVVSAASQQLTATGFLGPDPGFQAVALGLVASRGGEGFTGADGGLCDDGSFEAGQLRVLHSVSLGHPTTAALVTGSFSGAASGVYLEAGDVVRVCTFARRSQRVDNVDVRTRKSFSITFSSAAFACTTYEDENGISQTLLQPAAFLPPLSQKELVKDFLVRTDTIPLADSQRKTVRLVSRSELSDIAGAALDLSAVVEVEAMEYLPSAGVGIGAIQFAPAVTDDPLTPAGTDVVRLAVGAGEQVQQVGSLFAPVGFRLYRQFGQPELPLPTCTDQAGLDTPRSEAVQDPKSAAPRLLRYTGLVPDVVVPFAGRTVAPGGAAWDGPLAWAGAAGAVAMYYPGTLARATRGHLAKAPANLTPATYRALTPGRRVWLHGAAYLCEGVSQYDLAAEDNSTTIELLREV